MLHDGACDPAFAPGYAIAARISNLFQRVVSGQRKEINRFGRYTFSVLRKLTFFNFFMSVFCFVLFYFFSFLIFERLIFSHLKSHVITGISGYRIPMA